MATASVFHRPCPQLSWLLPLCPLFPYFKSAVTDSSSHLNSRSSLCTQCLSFPSFSFFSKSSKSATPFVLHLLLLGFSLSRAGFARSLAEAGFLLGPPFYCSLDEFFFCCPPLPCSRIRDFRRLYEARPNFLCVRLPPPMKVFRLESSKSPPLSRQLFFFSPPTFFSIEVYK